MIWGGSSELVGSGSDLSVEPTDSAAGSNKGCERKGLPEKGTRLYGQALSNTA